MESHLDAAWNPRDVPGGSLRSLLKVSVTAGAGKGVAGVKARPCALWCAAVGSLGPHQPKHSRRGPVMSLQSALDARSAGKAGLLLKQTGGKVPPRHRLMTWQRLMGTFLLLMPWLLKEQELLG